MPGRSLGQRPIKVRGWRGVRRHILEICTREHDFGALLHWFRRFEFFLEDDGYKWRMRIWRLITSTIQQEVEIIMQMISTFLFPSCLHKLFFCERQNGGNPVTNCNSKRRGTSETISYRCFSSDKEVVKVVVLKGIRRGVGWMNRDMQVCLYRGDSFFWSKTRLRGWEKTIYEGSGIPVA